MKTISKSLDFSIPQPPPQPCKRGHGEQNTEWGQAEEPRMGVEDTQLQPAMGTGGVKGLGVDGMAWVWTLPQGGSEDGLWMNLGVSGR